MPNINKVVYYGDTLIDLSQDTVAQADVLSGKTVHLPSGQQVQGSMVNNGSTSATITTKAQQVVVPQGYTSGGTIQISSTEQNKIIAGNIKKDVQILGVTGTYEGGPSQGGPGWLPASADYTWESAYLNIAQSSAWASLLSQLTYNADDQCVIARSYVSAGVPMSQTERLVAFNFTSSNEGYGVAYVYDMDDGEGGTTTWIEPVYSTVTHYSSLTFLGEYWEAGVSASYIVLDTNYDHSSYDLGSLVPVINLPGSQSILGWDAFWAGSEIAFGDYDSSSDRNVGKSIIQNTVVNLSMNDVFKWMADNSGRVRIRPYFFKDNTYLQSIVFPALSVSIGSSSFEGCTNLSSVIITKMPQSTISHLESIGSRAFYGCTSLTEIAIYFYSMITNSIGDYAFAGCTSLTTVHFYNTFTIPTLGTNVFDTTSLQHIYVPSSAVSAYQSAWSQYASYISAEPT